MHEDYVSFELAKKLKEKGFQERSIAYYDNFGVFRFNECTCMSDDCIIDIAGLMWCHNNKTGGTYIDAPTIAQVLKWLRKKKIYIDIETCPSCATVHKVAFIATVKLNSIGSDMDSYCMLYSHCRWEDAAVDGIEYALDNLL